jgi:hypothetical protein
MINLQRARFLFLVPVLGLSLLTGCGSSSSDDTTSTFTEIGVAATDSTTAAKTDTPTETTAPTAAAANAFTDCLKAQGVEVPEGFNPGAGPGAGGAGGAIPEGVDLAKLQPAIAACQDKLPAGAGIPGGGGAAGADFSAYTTCLKDYGVAVPEPFDASKLDLTDPKFAAASTTCQPLLPAGLPGLGAGGPTTIVAG